jgi:hypothetical protein
LNVLYPGERFKMRFLRNRFAKLTAMVMNQISTRKKLAPRDGTRRLRERDYYNEDPMVQELWATNESPMFQPPQDLWRKWMRDLLLKCEN